MIIIELAGFPIDCDEIERRRQHAIRRLRRSPGFGCVRNLSTPCDGPISLLWTPMKLTFTKAKPTP